jgi:hypothetical protein
MYLTSSQAQCCALQAKHEAKEERFLLLALLLLELEEEEEEEEEEGEEEDGEEEDMGEETELNGRGRNT